MLGVEHWILDYYHPKGFVIDAQDNELLYRVLLFKQPLTIMIDEKPVNVSSDYCIVYKPNTRRHYFNNESGYYHDGIFFGGEDAKALIESLDIMCNVPFPVKNPSEISNLIREIGLETISEDDNRDNVIDLRLRILLYKLKNSLYAGKKELHGYAKNFYNLRQDIYANPGKNWNAKETADNMYMSLSRFHHLYKDIFLTTFKQDVIESRIKRAKHLLRNESCCVKDIASLLGYNNEEHFLRQFKNSAGVTPGSYREKKLDL